MVSVAFRLCREHGQHSEPSLPLTPLHAARSPSVCTLASLRFTLNREMHPKHLIGTMQLALRRMLLHTREFCWRIIPRAINQTSVEDHQRSWKHRKSLTKTRHPNLPAGNIVDLIPKET